VLTGSEIVNAQFVTVQHFNRFWSKASYLVVQAVLVSTIVTGVEAKRIAKSRIALSGRNFPEVPVRIYNLN